MIKKVSRGGSWGHRKKLSLLGLYSLGDYLGSLISDLTNGQKFPFQKKNKTNKQDVYLI